MSVPVGIRKRRPVERTDSTPISLANPSGIPRSFWYLCGKAVLELVIALLLLVITSPVLLLATLLVKSTSRGSAFYSQMRVGKDGCLFRIYKIRTMIHDCERLTGARWAARGDSRIIPVGRFLRATHIDELPQLWNVLRGEMSMVGPRPERPEFVPELARLMPHYLERLKVRPGVTGLAQINLPPDTDLASVRRKLAYDLYYVRYASLWLDLRLILCTAFQSAGAPCELVARLFLMPNKFAVERGFRQVAKELTAIARRESMQTQCILPQADGCPG
jgi:lipopolysaccharide/colanic/teichoic acid biosynthesis glycosyltransferase